MGVIIPLPLRAREANAASRFELIGGEAHHATVLTFPLVQIRDIRDIWGLTVEGPPRSAPGGVAFSDGKPRRAKATRAKASVTKVSAAKLPDTKSAGVKRKPARRSPK
jgi:hypothetical protein